MRIIAGIAGGRKLSVPDTGTRPMTGRARESIFSILGARIVDARVLDLYAGSGSLGLESLSRGATEAVFVEQDRRAVAVIRENVAAIGLGGTVVQGVLPGVLARISGTFDVVFVDPPYADPGEVVSTVLAGLEGALAPSGLVVLHRRSGGDVVWPEFLTSVDERRYGDAVVTMMEEARS